MKECKLNPTCAITFKSVKSLNKAEGSLKTQKAQGDTTMRGEGVNRGKK